MVDTLTPDQRSERMSRIRGVNTKPEITLRSALHKLGFRFRLHVKELPGTPDIVLPKYNAVIFVHGCFWHHHRGCKIGTTPKSNTGFWQEKFKRNRGRDARNIKVLRSTGWRVMIAWECKIDTPTRAKQEAERLISKLAIIDTRSLP